jgi:Domain of unknown function (DUF1877)
MSITVSYYRMPKEEREKATHDQAAWDAFRKKILDAWQKAFQSAFADVKDFKGTVEEKMKKADSLFQARRDPRQFDIEKDWQILVYLFTGETEIVEENIKGKPLHNIIYGGIKTLPETGYGPVRYFDQAMVAEITGALKTADREQLKKRFDPAKMKELKIYAPPEESEREIIFKGIEQLTQYFQTAASVHDEVVTFVS